MEEDEEEEKGEGEEQETIYLPKIFTFIILVLYKMSLLTLSW